MRAPPCGTARWLIPARAGTTRSLLHPTGVGWAHPRSRGDHLSIAAPTGVNAGSSPLARGPRITRASPVGGGGLIPARAGTTRGAVLSAGGLHGSSPLARGPRFDALTGENRAGLIPARAGTTSMMESKRPATWAHPRSRGDHSRAWSSVKMRPGSSPLARGPHRAGKRSLDCDGLIPARAGTTM